MGIVDNTISRELSDKLVRLQIHEYSSIRDSYVIGAYEELEVLVNKFINGKCTKKHFDTEAKSIITIIAEIRGNL